MWQRNGLAIQSAVVVAAPGYSLAPCEFTVRFRSIRSRRQLSSQKSKRGYFEFKARLKEKTDDVPVCRDNLATKAGVVPNGNAQRCRAMDNKINTKKKRKADNRKTEEAKARENKNENSRDGARRAACLSFSTSR